MDGPCTDGDDAFETLPKTSLVMINDDCTAPSDSYTDMQDLRLNVSNRNSHDSVAVAETSRGACCRRETVRMANRETTN